MESLKERELKVLMAPLFRFFTLILVFAIGCPLWGSQVLVRSGLYLPPLTYESLLREEVESRQDVHGILSEGSLESLGRSPAVQVSLFEIADMILANFPPFEYDYVSLGRSGAALSLALELRLEQMKSSARVLELPFSGLRTVGDGNQELHFFRARWYPENLEKHFRRFFGPFRVGIRKVLVLDAVFYGQTMAAFAEILHLAEQKGWIDRDVHLLGMLDPETDEFLLRQMIRGYEKNENIPSDRWHYFRVPLALAPFFRQSAFDVFSRYGGWPLRDAVYEQRARVYFDGREELGGEPVLKESGPAEPLYWTPPDNESPGFFRRLFRLGRETPRQELKEEMRETLAIDPHLGIDRICQKLLKR